MTLTTRTRSSETSDTCHLDYKALRKSGDMPDLKNSDSFPFLFDGRPMAKGPKPPLQDYSPSLLPADNLLAVETKISTFNMTGRGDSSGRHGYSFSIRELYFLGGDDLSPPLGSGKRQGHNKSQKE